MKCSAIDFRCLLKSHLTHPKPSVACTLLTLTTTFALHGMQWIVHLADLHQGALSLCFEIAFYSIYSQPPSQRKQQNVKDQEVT